MASRYPFKCVNALASIMSSVEEGPSDKAVLAVLICIGLALNVDKFDCMVHQVQFRINRTDLFNEI